MTCTPLPGEAVQVGGGNAREGLSFARLHLGDPALVQDDGAHELHVEDALPQLPPRRLAHQRVRFGQERVQRLALRDPAAELVGLRREIRLGVGPSPPARGR